ncbi:unnamed protein product [Brachionus calyciflorus]|uniref:Uncharacterized protein n=1 Tax=Brachionus calyciflorus TaxID=104777 RepID=A0A814GTC2_9BILA|nr:unnamed protein product [Brachionus calyciflorus]
MGCGKSRCCGGNQSLMALPVSPMQFQQMPQPQLQLQALPLMPLPQPCGQQLALPVQSCGCGPQSFGAFPGFF